MDYRILHTGVKRFNLNTKGRDLAVGDIHGCFTELQVVLDRIEFNPHVDRLFSVGDLIDRGSESEEALHWLKKPWFHSIQGNHETICVLSIEGDNRYAMYTEAWLDDMPIEKQLEFFYAFKELPLIIEVQTSSGLVALVHADFPFNDWLHLDPKNIGVAETYICQWSRERIDSANEELIQNIRAVIHGHTPLRKMAILGNTYFIDTAGWMSIEGGFFTILDLNTLQQIYPFQ